MVESNDLQLNKSLNLLAKTSMIVFIGIILSKLFTYIYKIMLSKILANIDSLVAKLSRYLLFPRFLFFLSSEINLNKPSGIPKEAIATRIPMIIKAKLKRP